jgi:hypothetical protein
MVTVPGRAQGHHETDRGEDQNSRENENATPMTTEQNVLEQSRMIASFIGKPLHQANVTVRGICWLKIKNRLPLPEYLKGIARFDDLPRVDQRMDCDHHVSIDHLASGKIYERIDWIIENGKGSWCMTTKGFGFEEYSDAVLYKLKFDN